MGDSRKPKFQSAAETTAFKELFGDKSMWNLGQWSKLYPGYADMEKDKKEDFDCTLCRRGYDTKYEQGKEAAKYLKKASIKELRVTSSPETRVRTTIYAYLDGLLNYCKTELQENWMSKLEKKTQELT